ncbi:hypothetical protein [Agaribacter marinus]|uniref:STAS/SEC14 domain-containing protein n=1 Tax=Agaribacter marinus TaxID=1431249 RepID=A0AA37WH50_9ALTE|nr:hypothetical protein [Agaribacter marinus]GLR69573.1 hypothetical protein GCM10007852_04810 [Agaribacter marinus]
MIETSIISEDPVIVLHVLQGSFTKEEAKLGIDSAISVIEHATSIIRTFSLIVDARNYIFNDIDAHKVWSLNFKENPLVIDGVIRAAIVGSDEPKFHAEKENMESTTLKFFTDCQTAIAWLENA